MYCVIQTHSSYCVSLFVGQHFILMCKHYEPFATHFDKFLHICRIIFFAFLAQKKQQAAELVEKKTHSTTAEIRANKKKFYLRIIA